jgi:predicted lipid-binding transport protein (Tim44 family)
LRSAVASAAERILKLRLAPLVGVLQLLALSAAALARGGGGSHSGGHSSSHSSHSSSHSSFGHSSFGHIGGYGHGVGTSAGSALFTILLMLVIFAIVIYIIYRANRAQRALAMAGGGAMQRMAALALERAAAVRAARAQESNAAREALTAMRSADPEFEPETFLQRAEMTYFLVKRAYQHRDVDAAKPCLLPGLFAAWSTGVQQLITDHKRPLLDNLNVRGMHVVDARHDATSGDAVVVHFDVVYRDKLLDDRDGRVLSDAGDDNQYGERWTFVRGTGVKTVTSGGVVAQKCPNCGAPLELSSDAHCKYCHADITSGAFDWSVATMVPAPFIGVSIDPLLDQVQMDPQQGLAAIKSTDPGFDPKAFLSRVQEAFSALQTAWQAREVDTARAFMSPGLYFSWSAQVEQMSEQHRRNILEGLRIDRVTPVRVLHGHVFDGVTVRIDATCADYEVDEGTQRVVFGDKTPRPFTEYWTFQRAVGTKTGAHALFDKVCPNCGAPLDVNQLGECKYCKAAVTSGRFDWVLSRIEQEEEFEESA